MKKNPLAWLVAILVCLTVVVGALNSTYNADFAKAETAVTTEKIPYKQLGDYLSGSATAKSGTFTSSPETIYDNSGMNGDDGITHKHSNNADKMWLSRTSSTPSDAAPVISLDRPNQLGLMFVWNYNKSDSLNNGLKKVTISYSVDKEDWTDLGDFTFAKSSGGSKIKATNLEGSGSPIDFGGVYAKHIRITPKDTEGNWGGDAYGLSEVKIYEFKVEAKPGAYIKASPFASSSVAFFRAVEQQSMLTDGSGLDSIKSSKALHDNNPANMWKGTATQVLFNLKGKYPISDMYIWNYNDPEHLDYGAKSITVEYTSDPAFGVFTKLDDFDIRKGSGKTGEAAAIRIPFNNIKAQIIRVRINSNHGGMSNGLSAVRFYCGKGDYVESAHEWSSVINTYDGVFGADGIFSASMDGVDYGKSLDQRSASDKVWFVFSDTDVLAGGKVIDEINRTSTGFNMPNNTYATFVGNDAFDGEIERLYNGKYFLKPTIEGDGPRWWLGDTIIHNDKIYLTPHLVENYSGGMGFKHTGGTVISLDIKDGKADFDKGVNPGYFNEKNEYMTYFGDGSDFLLNAGFFSNTEEAGAPDPDGYIYNYGNHNISGGRYLVVARVKAEDFEDLTKYEYYDANGNWVKGLTNAGKGPSNVSPELSVTPITFGENAGKYMLVYQHNTQSPVTSMRISDTPWGTWSEASPVHYTVEPFYMSQIYDRNAPQIDGYSYCYNAKAHPALSKSGELIMSYNMNYMGGTNHSGHLKNIDNYHPRFLRLTSTGTVEVTDNKGVGDSVIYVTDITINKTELSLVAGDSETLTIAIAPTNAANKNITWKTSDSAVATVDENGKVTAIKAGTATISAETQDGSDLKKECMVTVTEADTGGKKKGCGSKVDSSVWLILPGLGALLLVKRKL